MVISSTRAVLVASVLLGCATPALGDQPGFRYLHTTPTETDPGFDPELPLTVSVALPDPSLLRDALPPQAILAETAGGLVVRLDPYPALVESHPGPLASTYLIDYEDDAVRELIEQRASEERPSLEELVVWVRETIEPSSDRGVDSASLVARNRRGDCTEHAVLLTAFARRFGYPARVVMGQVVVQAGTVVQSFGHAWTDVQEDGRWRLVDATPIEGARAIGYLPSGAIRDEGYGYVMDLMRVQSVGVTRVGVLAPQAAGRPMQAPP